MIPYETTYRECMTEMFHRVGLKYPNVFISTTVADAEWYRFANWTEREQSDFSAWMVDLLRKRYGWMEKKAKYEAGTFILDVGWITS